MLIFQDLLTWRFWRHFLISSFAIIGGISTVLQSVNVIFPKFDLLQGWPTLLLMLAISLLGGLAFSWPRPITQEYNAPRTRISIVKGDLFDETDHLVIGMCDTFDTEPPNIIALGSLQAQALHRLFGQDLHELDRLLAAALAGKQSIGSINKPGKTLKYGIGAIATVNQAGRHIFFLAYTELNDKNVAVGSVDGIWKSLAALWEEICNRGNGRTVCMPVIGGGQARLSSVMPAQDSIRFIVLSFMLASRVKKICDELRIVVRPEDYKKLDRLELQSYLASLRTS
jgi:hypothetical protein